MLIKRNLIKLAILLIEEDFYKKASYYNKNHRSKKRINQSSCKEAASIVISIERSFEGLKRDRHKGLLSNVPFLFIADVINFFGYLVHDRTTITSFAHLLFTLLALVCQRTDLLCGLGKVPLKF